MTTSSKNSSEPQPREKTATASRRKICGVLFWEFFKIASIVLGGGFAILLVAEDIFVKKHKWLKANELTNTLALIQTIPGLTAGNVAIYTGYRCAGLPGALSALTGVATPSFTIITIIAMFFRHFPVDHPLVNGAFLGVRTATTALLIVTLVTMWKQSLETRMQLLFFAVTLILTLLFHINPGWILLAGMLFGLGYLCFFHRRIKMFQHNG